MAKLNFLEELENHISLFQAPARSKSFIGANYIGAGRSKLIYKDLLTKDIRSVLKKKLSVSDFELEIQFESFESVWFSSNIFEVKSICLYWLGSLSDDKLIQLCPRVFKWSSEIDNWALSDGLCSIYARILEKKSSIILPTLKKWNGSTEPWLQRISMVSLFYYARQRKKQPTFKLVLGFIKPHMSSVDYYVQKAVGWTLRELYNVYPRQTLQFIDKNIKQISSVAWVAASEKLKSAVKSRLLKKRKLNKK